MSVVLQERVDIKENILFELDKDLLNILLKDRTSNNNLLWATDEYNYLGENYSISNQITVELITGINGEVIKPRIEKSKQEQVIRIRQKAEVFTPSWVCNAQNNLIDNAWFEKENVFNKELEKSWETNKKTISFPKKLKKTWQDYVNDTRLEITCGEAPYLTSRYDTVTGIYIIVPERIGLLDRKLRIVYENTETKAEWIEWAKIAVQNIYGYDWQGDNVFLARENILISTAEHYEYKFNEKMSVDILKEFAEIISWNIWQMDGLKFVIPNSCKAESDNQLTLFDINKNKKECEGCKTNNNCKHNGIYCFIMDWQNYKKVRFVDLTKGVASNGK